MGPAVAGIFRKWLSLQEASERLNVHPATLREWADKGLVRSFRTPGRHRRFAEEDVAGFAPSASGQPSPELDLLLSAAVGRARLKAGGGRLAGESWYGFFNEKAKERHRVLGRELLTLLVQYLGQPAGADAILDRALPIGREYGRLARQLGLSLSDAMRAFLLFRDAFMESVLQMTGVRARHPGAPNALDLHSKVSHFVNEILIAMLQAYSEEGK